MGWVGGRRGGEDGVGEWGGCRRHGVWLAIGYGYKLGQKMNLNFSAN